MDTCYGDESSSSHHEGEIGAEIPT